MGTTLDNYRIADAYRSMHANDAAYGRRDGDVPRMIAGINRALEIIDMLEGRMQGDDRRRLWEARAALTGSIPYSSAFERISGLHESYGGGRPDRPRIYVGTYAKYNNGSLDGAWVDLSEFGDYSDFVEHCERLHEDEDDPEFMVQDFEGFPNAWYRESGLPTEEEFDRIRDFYLMDDSRKDAYEAYVEHTGNSDVDDFEEAYAGDFDSPSDFAANLVDEIGWEGMGDSLETYFDYDAFGRDLMMDFSVGEEGEVDADGEPQSEGHYYDRDGYDMGEYESDEQVGRDYVENIGGVSQLGDQAVNYFDYDAFGRDLLVNDYFEEGGHYFREV